MIAVIASATAREALRSRTFLSLLAVYAVAALLARLGGWVSSTDGHVVTTGFVLSLQSLLGVLVAVATGTALVQTEIQSRTLYTVLARPIPRWHFVVGKYLGLAAALAAGQAAMLAIGLAWLWVTGAQIHHWLLLAGLLTAVEVLVMAAVSLCLTTLTGPLLSAVLSLAIYALGHAVAELPGLLHHLQGGWKQVMAASLASVIPNLGMFAYRNDAAHLVPLPVGDLLRSLGYGALWIALLVTVTISLFRRRHL